MTWAQDISVEASGFGVTKNDALTQAKREALAQGIGQVLQSQTEVENFMVKRDVILTETMGFVKNFTVLKEVQGSDGAWEVRIRASVAKDGLMQDLMARKIILDAVGNPRVAVLITETNIDNGAPTANQAETILLDSLKSRGFRMVDANQALRFRESADGVKAMGGDPDAVAKLGSKLNADVLIVGSAVAKESDVSNIPAMAKSGMKSASATITLKAYNVSTREVLAAKSTTAAMANINSYTAGNKAIEKGVVSLLDSKGGFFASIMESWRKASNDGASFTLSIDGVVDFATAKTVKTALTSVAPNYQQDAFNKPVLELTITRTGKAEDLAEALDGLKVGKGKLVIDTQQGNALTAHYQP